MSRDFHDCIQRAYDYRLAARRLDDVFSRGPTRGTVSYKRLWHARDRAWQLVREWLWRAGDVKEQGAARRCARCADARVKVEADWLGCTGDAVPTHAMRRCAGLSVLILRSCTQDDGPAPEWCPRRAGR